MADAADSKSAAFTGVWVQVPPPAPFFGLPVMRLPRPYPISTTTPSRARLDRPPWTWMCALTFSSVSSSADGS